MPTWVFWLLKSVIRDIGALYGKFGHKNEYLTKYPDVYAYRYTDQRQSVRDTIESMAAHGWLKL